MIIQQLRLNNFRKFENQEFRFNDNFNVLIGDNASGKTQVLDAVSIILYSYLLDMEMKPGRHINKNDARIFSTITNELVNTEEVYPIKLSAVIRFRDRNYDVCRELKKATGRTTWLEAQDIKLRGYWDLHNVRNGKEVTFPVLAYYGTGRLWHMKRHTEVESTVPRVNGYRNCLDPFSDHLDFQKWFIKQEHVALQKQIVIPALQAVRKAVKGMIPGCRNFYYDFQTEKIILEFEDEPYCPFSNLSDGFRNMTAMVADIAYRSSALNPQFGDSVLQSITGVVIIDEIDLHLHPTWQRSVVDDLKRTFPKIQFIATTHSPFIIQSLGPGEVIDLNNINNRELNYVGGDYGTPAPEAEYVNKSIEDIAENVMGVEDVQRSQRFTDMYEAAKKYYQLLDNATTANAHELELIKKRLDELIAPFSDNVAYYAFLEMKREAAGLNEHNDDEGDK